MSTLQQKSRRWKKGAGEAADQALHKLMHLHIQWYERLDSRRQRELAPFEQQYGLSSSAECHQRFLAGEMGDSADITEWMGLYEDVLLYQERLGTLRAATEA